MAEDQGNPKDPAEQQNDQQQDQQLEQKEPDLRESLDAEYELAEKGADASDLSAAAKRLAAARKPRADKEPKAEPAQGDQKAEPAADPEKKAEAQPLEAPQHWPAADREMFAKQPREVQEWMLGRHKSMEADYTRRSQEVAGVRKLREELDEIFQPFKQEMELSGITQAQAIRQLVAAHALLQNDPAAGIRRLAEQYGADLKSLVEEGAAADPAGESPTVQALRKQVEQLTGKLNGMAGAQDESQFNARVNEVTQFAEEKDAEGKPLHPHFDEVAKDVASMIHAARANGETIALKDAYDRAVWANPTVRQKVLAAQDAERRAKEEAERKAKADAARKASFDVKGEGAAASAVANSGDLRASLEKAWDEAEGRV